MVPQSYWSKGGGEKKKIQERSSKKEMWETHSKEGLKQLMNNTAYKNFPNILFSQTFDCSGECFIKGPCSLFHEVFYAGLPRGRAWDGYSGACDLLKGLLSRKNR